MTPSRKRAFPLASMVVLAACGPNGDSPLADASVRMPDSGLQEYDAAQAEREVADAGIDASNLDASERDAAPERDASLQDDAATSDAGAGDSGGACVSGPVPLGVVTAELLVVFDASGSTQPAQPMDCRKAAANSPDFFMCALLGVDCSQPQFAGGSYCGGPLNDHFSAAVSAVNAVATQLQSRLPVGLMIFPGARPTQSTQCAPGDELVAPRLGSAAELAAALAATTPEGNSPVAATLRHAFTRINARVGSAAGEPRRTLLLLVTDGRPSCAGTPAAALSETLAAIDELKMAGMPTLVLAHDEGLSVAEQQTLTSLAVRGGGADYWRTNQSDALSAELDRAAHAQSCWFELGTMPAAGASLRVSLDGAALLQDSPSGFILHDRRLTLRGQACERLMGAGQHTLTAEQVCSDQP